MAHISLALVGFGNVGQAFVRLLLCKRVELEVKYQLTFQVNGIATGSHGMAINPSGLDLVQALNLAEAGLSLSLLHRQPLINSVMEFIQTVPADVLFENSPVNHQTGQPAAGYLEAALRRGMHAVTANKGPVAHAFHELNELASVQGRRFLFESAVMDGAPIFSLFRGPLPAVELKGFHGILNSCTNLILGRMEQGETFAQAVAYAQSIGIAETDPAADIDGWDAAIKVAAMATVLMDCRLKPQQVDRTGIRGITPIMLSKALESGRRCKLVCSCERNGPGVTARVGPEWVTSDSPLYAINGTSSYVQFELDVLPGLGIVESNPGPKTTAYGLLADLVNAARGM